MSKCTDAATQALSDWRAPMIDIHFKRTSVAIDDEDLEAVAAAVRAHMARAISNRHADADTDYYLLMAKMLFRIVELKMQVRETGAAPTQGGGQNERNQAGTRTTACPDVVPATPAKDAA